MANKLKLVGAEEAVRGRQRLRLSTPVCVVIEKPDKVVFVNARFVDLSDDGTAVFAGAEIAIDSEIQIEFTPPFGTGPLRVRAIVRNRRKYIYGLEFLPKNAEEEKTLHLLKSLLLPIGTKTAGTPDDRSWD
jgi:hypothetical protein